MLHLDTGNTGFMLLCASLVMLMTPGLAFFYGGLVGRNNVLAIMDDDLVVGFRLFALPGITLATPSPNDSIPMVGFCDYQMML